METTKRLHGFGNVGAKLFDDKSVLRLARTEGQLRWRRLDFSLSRALQAMIRSSGESLSEDVALKARAFAQKSIFSRKSSKRTGLCNISTLGKTSKRCNGRAMTNNSGFTTGGSS